MKYRDFFRQATGIPQPFPYQERLVQGTWPDLVDVPTGLGKTAAVVVAWLYKRHTQNDALTPRRLVYCLPMRVLVEQTQQACEKWLQNLGLLGKPGEGRISVSVLIGGSDHVRDAVWAKHPEESQIIIGTQDMLLSRALMRGYGMSRYQWPIHFALLHNDVLWAFDEVQLMGAGLPTSAQLEAFRRSFPLARGSRSLWLSATLNPSWLSTVDLKPHMDSFRSLSVDDEDRRLAADRLEAIKAIKAAPMVIGKDSGDRKSQETYLKDLCAWVLKIHDSAAQTLIIVNRVDRAQGLFRLLQKQREGCDLLIHSRFRPAERAEQARRLREEPAVDRIIVATQAVEAGVDISSKNLITELAPWSSVVQRFGRCNRYGEHNTLGDAQIFWIDIEDDRDNMRPYSVDELTSARSKLVSLTSASPAHLSSTNEQRPLSAVIRRRDLLDLFNTDPDLSGFDVDVSDYIRDTDLPGLQVFWREFDSDPNEPQMQPSPERSELCPISIGQAKGLHKRARGAWQWDGLDESWVKLHKDPRPGMTLLLNATDGGYDNTMGFDAELKRPVPVVVATERSEREEAFGADPLTQIGCWVSLPRHLADAASFACKLCELLDVEASLANAIIRASRWHDLGKAHEAFQCALRLVSAPPDDMTQWAKSDRRGRLVYRMCREGSGTRRPFFRHELASMLCWLAQHEGEAQADLIAYLIAAHHGKVRMSLRAMPSEKAGDHVRRFARGVWEGDVLPAIEFDGERSNEVTLRLGLMELGEGEQGPSWASRTLKLLGDHGPFKLAWLETLVRLADWRASAAEQAQGDDLK
jgi:CRISPR-associated endonuclease/helicase Cas3